MSYINWNAGPVTQRVKDRLNDTMTLLGAQGVSWCAQRLRANGYSEATKHPTGNLVNSISYSTHTGQGGGTPGIAQPEEDLRARIGSVVVYAARVEFGFVGTDSLGRHYNQPPKSYLRAGLDMHRTEIYNLIRNALQ